MMVASSGLLWGVLLAALLVVDRGQLSGAQEEEEEEEVVSVMRNESGRDVSWLMGSSEGPCRSESCDVLQTYLVKERECVNDTTLQGKTFQNINNERNCALHLVPVISNSTESIATKISESGKLLVLDSESGTFDDAKLHRCGNGCTVTGLSVARGKDLFFPIMHHEAFSVNATSGCEIMVNISVYEELREDFDGELYRMNVTSCGPTQDDGDCMFFKLVGTTNIARGKFNNAVPPITSHSSLTCDPTSPTLAQQQNDSNNSVNSSSGTPEDATTTESNNLLDDPILTSILFGSVGAITLLMCFIFLLCCGICCLTAKSRRKRAKSRRLDLRALQNRSNSASTAQTTAVVEAVVESQPGDDDHTYTDVKEVQAEAKEVREPPITFDVVMESIQDNAAYGIREDVTESIQDNAAYGIREDVMERHHPKTFVVDTTA